MAKVKVYQLFTEPLTKGPVLFGRSSTYTDTAVTNPTQLFWDNTNFRLGVGTSTPTAPLNVEGAVIFNDTGADVDVRMEGSSQANLFFLDAGNDRIGINQATPTHQFDIVGDLACTNLYGQNQTQNADDTLYFGPSTANHNIFLDREGAGAQFVFGYNTPKLIGTPDDNRAIVSIYDNATDQNLIFSAKSEGTTGGQTEILLNQAQADVDFRWKTDAGDYGIVGDAANANITINAASVSAHYDLGLCGDGVLMLKETTTPTADTNYGKVYTKNTNNLFFQDGAGNEYTLLTTGAGAPIGSKYWVSEADATLTAEINLGALTTGLLKHSVSAGVSTPATATAGTDYFSQDSHVDHNQTTNYDANEHMDTTGWGADLVPDGDNARDLGAVGGTDYRWKDLYLSGSLSDETNSLTIANAKSAYDHVSDSSQAHSDYLINDGADSTTGRMTAAGFTSSENLIVADAKDIAFTSGAKIERDTSGNIKLTPEAGLDVLSVMRTKARAYRSGTQDDLVSSNWTKVQLNAESYDIGSDFDATTNYYFTAPITGYYSIDAEVFFINVVADKRYGMRINKNAGTEVAVHNLHSALAANLSISMSVKVALTANDTIQLDAVSYAGVNTVDIFGGVQYTFMSIHLLSVDS